MAYTGVLGSGRCAIYVTISQGDKFACLSCYHDALGPSSVDGVDTESFCFSLSIGLSIETFVSVSVCLTENRIPDMSRTEERNHKMNMRFHVFSNNQSNALFM